MDQLPLITYRKAKLEKARLMDIKIKRILAFCITTISISFFLWQWLASKQLPPVEQEKITIVPLVMKGGDPYIRALMRTISASESNVSRPYFVMYGGEYVSNLHQHPDRCIRIVSGPNRGNCSTAAGRYQMITTTWEEKAKLYHSHAENFILWKSYSFAPEFQDEVVYKWLNDREAWNADIPALLRQGKLNDVLKLLSNTWTSLGYGIENNSMTSSLPTIYQEILQEELKANQQKTIP